MGFSIQIRYDEELLIPEDSGYKPPQPNLPNYISLDYDDMKMVVHLMIHTGSVDRDIRTSKDKKNCKPGLVPAYKFLLNEGYVVTAKEAWIIADKLGAQDISDPEFLKRLLPKLKTIRKEHLDYITEVVDVWLPFNRVAAANKGYTVK